MRRTCRHHTLCLFYAVVQRPSLAFKAHCSMSHHVITRESNVPAACCYADAAGTTAPLPCRRVWPLGLLSSCTARTEATWTTGGGPGRPRQDCQVQWLPLQACERCACGGLVWAAGGGGLLWWPAPPPNCGFYCVARTLLFSTHKLAGLAPTSDGRPRRHLPLLLEGMVSGGSAARGGGAVVGSCSQGCVSRPCWWQWPAVNYFYAPNYHHRGFAALAVDPTP